MMSPIDPEPDTSNDMDEADTANGEGGPSPASDEQRAMEHAEREPNDPVETP